MKRLLAIFSVFVLSLGIFSNTAFAEGTQTDGSAEVVGGDLSISVPAATTFGSLILDGTIQTTTAELGDVTVVDATGTGAGWNVNVKASDLTRDDLYSLPKDSITLVAPTVTAEAGSSSELAITTNGGTIDNEIGVTVLDAPVEEGKGTFNVSFIENSMSLELRPDTALAGVYNTTITWNLVSGPTN